MNLSCGILAGNRSNRQGSNKVLAAINQKNYLQTLAKELSCFDELLISCNYPQSLDIPEDSIPVLDEICDIGPIEGIRQIIRQARNEFVFICAGDMPFLKKELVTYMEGLISSEYDCYVVCSEDKKQPLCTIYSHEVLPEIEAMIGEGVYRLMTLLDRVRTKYIYLKSTCFSEKVVKNLHIKCKITIFLRPAITRVRDKSEGAQTGLIEQLINEFISGHWFTPRHFYIGA